MLIDWFTVSAQVFNFLILLWLLKRTLYQPILSAIDGRDQKIASQLKDADEKKAEAQKERDDYQHKNEEFEQQRQTLLAKATEEAKLERQRLIEAARLEGEALRGKLQEAVKQERESLNRELAARAQQEVFAIAHKLLVELAGSSLDEQITNVFIRRLRDLSDEQRSPLHGDSAVLRSASALSPAQSQALEVALKETLGLSGLQFEVRPDLVSGIELHVNGHKLGWSIADSLASLSKSVESAHAR